VTLAKEIVVPAPLLGARMVREVASKICRLVGSLRHSRSFWQAYGEEGRPALPGKRNPSSNQVTMEALAPLLQPQSPP
jgi:hypothetical protein